MQGANNLPKIALLCVVALLEGYFIFIWVNLISSRSCSNGQIFNHSELEENMEDRSLGQSISKPLIKGGRGMTYALLRDDAFALMPWLM